MAKPKPIGWKYKKSKPFNGKEWRVWGYVDGKRKQYWFSTEKAAKADGKKPTKFRRGTLERLPRL